MTTKMKLTIQANISPGTPKIADNYRRHLDRVIRNVKKFSATITDADRIQVIEELAAKMRTIPMSAELWRANLESDTPTEITGTVLRTSEGCGLMYWPDDNYLLALLGVPSLSVGSVVKLTPRAVETMKMKSAKEHGATWVHPELDSLVIVARGEQGVVGNLGERFPVGVLNMAFFNVEVLDRGQHRHETKQGVDSQKRYV